MYTCVCMFVCMHVMKVAKASCKAARKRACADLQ